MDRDALKVYRALVNAHLRRERAWETEETPEPPPKPDRMFTRDDCAFLKTNRIAAH